MAVQWITDVESGFSARGESRRPLFADFWSPG